MMAFVKPTARLFLGRAVNRQIPHPRLEMFSALCRAPVCSGGEDRRERRRWEKRDGQKRGAERKERKKDGEGEGRRKKPAVTQRQEIRSEVRQPSKNV